MSSSLRLSFLVLLLVSSLVSSRPSPQDPDSELVVRVPPPQLPAPFFLATPGEGAVVGEVLVSSPNVAVKRTNKKKNAKPSEGPTFAARVAPPASASSSALDDTNDIGDTIFFNHPSAVIQLS